jgi:hypothetical protein
MHINYLYNSKLFTDNPYQQIGNTLQNRQIVDINKNRVL